MRTSKKIIGMMIRLLRKRRGLTQQELADELDTDRQYVCKLEKGKVNITADYLDKVIARLECNHDDFFNKNDVFQQ